ncbi:MAG: thioredoxin family protein [Acidobacteria bacterium]|nr:thioredoxin family protein [Acidobacteriota bacterium]MCA1608566.1 thioredoxin family protein [Acidobacteriota bacterium]
MRRKIFALTAFMAGVVFVLSGPIASALDVPVGSTIENFTLPDTDGKTRSLKELQGKRGAVIVFLSAQCPVVKGYNERINQVAADYAAKGINFIGINSNSTEDLNWVKTDAATVGYKFPVLIDKGNVLADKLGATVTPEVYYLDAKNVLLYHGAIDNDRSGKAPTEMYLRTAFDSSLAGKPIAKTRANAFGCSIKRVGGASE